MHTASPNRLPPSAFRAPVDQRPPRLGFVTLAPVARASRTVGVADVPVPEVGGTQPRCPYGRASAEVIGMRDRDQRLRNEVEHPERYEEVTITSSGVPIVLSVWHGQPGGPVAVFLPGTMTHPLFYEEFCDALAAQGITRRGGSPRGARQEPARWAGPAFGESGRQCARRNSMGAREIRALPRCRGLQPRRCAGDDRRYARPRARRRGGSQHPRSRAPCFHHGVAVSDFPTGCVPPVRARPTGAGQAFAPATDPASASTSTWLGYAVSPGPPSNS